MLGITTSNGASSYISALPSPHRYITHTPLQVLRHPELSLASCQERLGRRVCDLKPINTCHTYFSCSCSSRCVRSPKTTLCKGLPDLPEMTRAGACRDNTECVLPPIEAPVNATYSGKENAATRYRTKSARISEACSHTPLQLASCKDEIRLVLLRARGYYFQPAEVWSKLVADC
jgi:hypothetical protein